MTIRFESARDERDLPCNDNVYAPEWLDDDVETIYVDDIDEE